MSACTQATQRDLEHLKFSMSEPSTPTAHDASLARLVLFYKYVDDRLVVDLTTDNDEKQEQQQQEQEPLGFEAMMTTGDFDFGLPESEDSDSRMDCQFAQESGLPFLDEEEEALLMRA